MSSVGHFTHLSKLSIYELQSILTFLNFRSLLQIYKSCTFLHKLINSSTILAKQTLLHYYSTVYIDTTIDSNHQIEPIDIDIDMNYQHIQQPILPIFDPLCFNQMILFNNTNIFRLYSRLMSYNWKLHLLLQNIDKPISEQIRNNQRGPFMPHLLINIGIKFNNELMTEQQLINAYISELQLMDEMIYDQSNINDHEARDAMNECSTYHPPTNQKYTSRLDIICNKYNKIYNTLQLINIYNPININKFRKRALNPMELQLFHRLYQSNKITNYFKYINQTNNDCKRLCDDNNNLVINNEETFKLLLETDFNFLKWHQLIFPINREKHKFFLAGGSVLKCIWKQYKIENKSKINMQDLDFFAVGIRHNNFIQEIKKIKLKFRKNGYKYIHHSNQATKGGKICIHNLFVNFMKLRSAVKFPSKYRMYSTKRKQQNEIIMEKEGFWTKMQFIWMGDRYKPWSILHSFDLDCCQIGYDGKNVVSTFAFLQSITTDTMISYKLINNKSMIDTFISRIDKYSRRGFHLIVPKKYNMDIIDDKGLDESKAKIIKKTRKKILRELMWKLSPRSEIAGFSFNNDLLGIRREFIHFIKDFGGKTDLTFYEQQCRNSMDDIFSDSDDSLSCLFDYH